MPCIESALPAFTDGPFLEAEEYVLGAMMLSPHAIEVVLLFRLITFWAPAAFGVLATRRLYKRKAI